MNKKRYQHIVAESDRARKCRKVDKKGEIPTKIFAYIEKKQSFCAQIERMQIKLGVCGAYATRRGSYATRRGAIATPAARLLQLKFAQSKN